MISDLDKLYNTISNDLKIYQLKNEYSSDFHFRLIYSAIGSWILKLAQDRDYEDGPFKQVSKSHVTITACDVLDSFIKADSRLVVYFSDKGKDVIKEIVNRIEETYVGLGYLVSGRYSFSFSKEKINISISNDIALSLGSNLSNLQMIGLGLFNNSNSSSIKVADFFFIKDNAITYFDNFISTLNFQKQTTWNGKVEIYNAIKHRWDILENSNQVDEYSVLRHDALTYSIAKKVNEDILLGKLPEIYNKTSNDFYFKHEVWRLILGLLAYLGKNGIIYFKKYFPGCFQIKFNGIFIPQQERCLIEAVAWPFFSALDKFGYIVDNVAESYIKEICNHLCINIIDER